MVDDICHTSAALEIQRIVRGVTARSKLRLLRKKELRKKPPREAFATDRPSTAIEREKQLARKCNELRSKRRDVMTEMNTLALKLHPLQGAPSRPSTALSDSSTPPKLGWVDTGFQWKPDYLHLIQKLENEVQGLVSLLTELHPDIEQHFKNMSSDPLALKGITLFFARALERATSDVKNQRVAMQKVIAYDSKNVISASLENNDHGNRHHERSEPARDSQQVAGKKLGESFVEWKILLDDISTIFESIVVVARPEGGFNGRMRPVLERRAGTPAFSHHFIQGIKNFQKKESSIRGALSNATSNNVGGNKRKLKRIYKRSSSSNMQHQPRGHKPRLSDAEHVGQDIELREAMDEEMQLRKLQTLLISAQAQNHRNVRSLQLRLQARDATVKRADLEALEGSMMTLEDKYSAAAWGKESDKLKYIHEKLTSSFGDTVVERAFRVQRALEEEIEGMGIKIQQQRVENVNDFRFQYMNNFWNTNSSQKVLYYSDTNNENRYGSSSIDRPRMINSLLEGNRSRSADSSIRKLGKGHRRTGSRMQDDNLFAEREDWRLHPAVNALVQYSPFESRNGKLASQISLRGSNNFDILPNVFPTVEHLQKLTRRKMSKEDGKKVSLPRIRSPSHRMIESLPERLQQFSKEQRGLYEFALQSIGINADADLLDETLSGPPHGRGFGIDNKPNRSFKKVDKKKKKKKKKRRTMRNSPYGDQFSSHKKMIINHNNYQDNAVLIKSTNAILRPEDDQIEKKTASVLSLEDRKSSLAARKTRPCNKSRMARNQKKLRARQVMIDRRLASNRKAPVSKKSTRLIANVLPPMSKHLTATDLLKEALEKVLSPKNSDKAKQALEMLDKEPGLVPKTTHSVRQLVSNPKSRRKKTAIKKISSPKSKVTTRSENQKQNVHKSKTSNDEKGQNASNADANNAEETENEMPMSKNKEKNASPSLFRKFHVLMGKLTLISAKSMKCHKRLKEILIFLNHILHMHIIHFMHDLDMKLNTFSIPRTLKDVISNFVVIENSFLKIILCIRFLDGQICCHRWK